jgi:hypothetical protein
MRLLLEHGAVADVYYDFAGSIIPWTSRCRTSVHNADDRPDVNAGSEDKLRKMPLHVAASLRGEASAQVLRNTGLLYHQCTRQTRNPLGAVRTWGYYLSTGRT